jgi:hypothetical protein
MVLKFLVEFHIQYENESECVSKAEGGHVEYLLQNGCTMQ